MAQTTCIECGYPFNGTETSCPECGSPIQSQNPTPSTPIIIDEGDNDAEKILRNTLNWIKIIAIILFAACGIVTCIYSFFMMAYTSSFWIPFLSFLGGLLIIFLGFFIAKLIWAFGMIFINISTNVRIIKKSISIKN